MLTPNLVTGCLFLYQDQIYNYRVKAAVYILCHPANKVLLPAVKEIMEKHDGQSTSSHTTYISEGTHMKQQAF